MGGDDRRTVSSFLGGLFRPPWIPPPQAPFASQKHNNNNNNNHGTTPNHARIRQRRQRRRRQDSGHDDRPPSLGTRERLSSINDDDWTERDRAGGGQSSSEDGDDDNDSDDDGHADSMQQRRLQHGWEEEHRQGDYHDEQTSLLPPTGISTNEKDGARQQYKQQSVVVGGPHRRIGSDHRRTPSSSNAMFLVDAKEVEAYNASRAATAAAGTAARSKKKKSSKRKKKKRRSSAEVGDQDGSSEDSVTEYHYQQWTQNKDRLLGKERAQLIAQWKAEAREEAELRRREFRHRSRSNSDFDRMWEKLSKLLYGIFAVAATFLANLPSTIGAVAMSVVTLGVVWFKFAEENLESCEPVHFHSSQCTFPEFPGCFYCKTDSKMYKLALNVHFGCTIIAGLLAMLFVLKVFIAPRVVLDEMSSPTTASPAGLLCMTTVCVFAGRGMIGQFMVMTAASIHVCLVLWFAYIALAYRILPDPSWFPNTVGIGLTAVKMWLYNPVWGYWLMAVSLVCNFFFFPISLIRVAINKKISATVGWMQMCAPAVSLYSLTIMAQPSFEEEHPDITKFQSLHRAMYLPCMHVMAGLAFLGFVSSCHCLWSRWHDFRTKEFSPAHAAFCFPVLAYANALQAYRGAIISFSHIHSRSWRMVVLYVFWFLVLVAGTVVTLWITVRFIFCLPRWTEVDLSGEEEPPAPNETILALRDMVTSGETMRQPFVSPAVLQANDTGALVLTTGGPNGGLRYVRTRRLTALGFEPMMSWIKVEEERNVLLDWVRTHPPRQRSRTLSVPGIDFQYGAPVEFGHGNSGVYGSIHWSGPPSVHASNNYY